MLSAEDNDILTRIGAGMPMGELMRRYWIPALLAEELKEPDGKPVRLRLMGEDLVAFRDTKGRVGLLEEQCPHRRASLALALNAECGLRCIYHGYKFEVDGRCVDAPTEPANSAVLAGVSAKAYPTREAGGVIWTYMGPAAEQPAFPEFEFLNMDAVHSVPFKVLGECNYAQMVEGTVDSAHAGILHKRNPWGAAGVMDFEKDLAPKIDVEPTAYGMRYAGLRDMGDGRMQARVTQVVHPFITFIPPGNGVGTTRRLANAFVPRDDYSTWHFQWFFDREKPIDVAFRINEGGHWVDENFRKLRNRDNWYLQDREMMKSGAMAGIAGILTQDHAVGETQGLILDRTKEKLGNSDLAVVAWRRQMIRAARTLAETGQAPSVLKSNMPWRKLESATVFYPANDSWKDHFPLDREAAAGTAEAAE